MSFPQNQTKRYKFGKNPNTYWDDATNKGWDMPHYADHFQKFPPHPYDEDGGYLPSDNQITKYEPRLEERFPNYMEIDDPPPVKRKWHIGKNQLGYPIQAETKRAKVLDDQYYQAVHGWDGRRRTRIYQQQKQKRAWQTKYWNNQSTRKYNQRKEDQNTDSWMEKHGY